MAIVAHARPFVIGVDTHARNHAISILACPTGEVIDEAQFPTTTAGLSRAVCWVGRRTGGDVDVLWVIEGTGTYGARLASTASDAGYTVVEAPRMNARANPRYRQVRPARCPSYRCRSPPAPRQSAARTTCGRRCARRSQGAAGFP